ncbi:hypothetical protein [Lentibacillus jeotgali]|uniref:hypothetical protein n=1 Tax=Lentibacillus jeotgali TaxID=558169 RepID=UPI0002627434|nr:hypothetical protein [Lentibacillus jeotgali]
MASSNQRKQDNASKEVDIWLEEDPFGLDEEIKLVLFKCKDCGGVDEVPEYLIGEFSVDKNNNEEVQLHCPHCNGTMVEARNAPSD